MSWIGLDIGGANIKHARFPDHIGNLEFPLWKHPEKLPAVLDELVQPFAKDHRLAITMTGELADCFESKQQGVESILDSLPSSVSKDNVFVYTTTGDFVEPDFARQQWQGAAASNWHALAVFAARHLPERTGILIDIGSTTTDIIPIQEGKVGTESKTDLDRLSRNELIYTGVIRSSIAGLIDSVQLERGEVRVANELFATTLDANLFLSNISQSMSNAFSADGRPATIRCATRRLAKMVCADPEELAPNDLRIICTAVIDAQAKLIAEAVLKVSQSHPECGSAIIVSGSGDWLAREALRLIPNRGHILNLAKVQSRASSSCGPAFAVMTLASEKL